MSIETKLGTIIMASSQTECLRLEASGDIYIFGQLVGNSFSLYSRLQTGDKGVDSLRLSSETYGPIDFLAADKETVLFSFQGGCAVIDGQETTDRERMLAALLAWHTIWCPMEAS